MSDTTPAPVPAGWYPDPAGGPGRRWWNGTAWTEQVEQPYSAGYAPPVLGAPAGTAPYTPWIWILALLPLSSLLSFFLLDVEAIVAQSLASDPSDPFAIPAPTTGELLTNGLGFAAWVLGILFAFLDWRELKKRRVDKPFHFAWSILLSLVYVIGRSVVVKRRIGTGLAPLWTAVAVTVLNIVVVVGVTIQLTAAVISELPALAP
ncbi:DUF2510 domain-containing protein [Microcella daejeonensis]|uniref:DUF2510 domain-containing protein n=1 Tax=Microcella daejeonensis TaxID=2994971 RepID=A0A9E8MJV4_9MICO|nr:DUF2510 domain-containing protein [Microcella daejeonensis]WAB80877.1 DUF2510 domain-containing protein [Microcella daejeonensis]